MTTKFQMAGEVEESSSRSENVKLWRVANVDQLGNITFAYTIESVKMWQQVGDTDPVSYDSKTDKEIPQEYAGTADEVGKPLAIFSIAPNGTIIDRKSNLKQDVFGVGKVTIPLPKKQFRLVTSGMCQSCSPPMMRMGRKNSKQEFIMNLPRSKKIKPTFGLKQKC